MAADMNAVHVVGRLTRDPEMRGSVCAIRLANSKRTKQGEEWVDGTNYFDVSVFGRQADTAFQYLTKGRRIGVTGRLEYREWEKDGEKRNAVQIIANDVYFLDSREDGPRPAKSDMEPDTRGLKGKQQDEESIPF